MMILRRDSTINPQSLLMASLKDDSINILFFARFRFLSLTLESHKIFIKMLKNLWACLS